MALCSGAQKLGQPVPHRQLVLRVQQGLRRRVHRDALGLQLQQVFGGYALVVEGQGVRARRDAAQVLDPVVVAEHDVGAHLGRGLVGRGGQDAQGLAQRDRGLMGHAGQLASADDANYGSSHRVSHIT